MASTFDCDNMAFLSALELADLMILHSWDPEIFAAITGPNGIVVGLFVGQKA